jgi:hypothetical protein
MECFIHLRKNYTFLVPKGSKDDLTPFIPLSVNGEGEVIKEGLAPLLNAPFLKIPLYSPLQKGKSI